MNAHKDIKCVVWDLDNTLWDGILLEGDDVALKSGVVDVIKILDERGILHSIASKNHYDDAMGKLRAFELDDYFLFPQISWNAKSQSISNIQAHLNIGMDTLLFIDDQPFERDEVKSVHPVVTCMDAAEYLTLPDLPGLNPKFITQDSHRRRLMYREDQQRKRDEADFQGPKTEFLASLNITFIISEAREEDLQRAEELTERTHQLNATGKTYDYDELKALMESPDHLVLACEMKDRYGAYGKIGLALVEIRPEAYHIRLLLMSCRVMSLGVGTVLLSHIMREAKRRGKQILADFRHTGRNRIMYTTFKFANFREIGPDESDTLILGSDLSVIHPFPPYIEVVFR